MNKPDKSNIQPVIDRIKQLHRLSELDVKEFALEGGLADQVVQGIGTGKLKATQLYKVFRTLKNMEQDVRRARPDDPFDNVKLLQLMPTLAYAVGRELIPKDFYQLLREVFDPKRLPTNADFLRAFEFVEAILAYHKYRSEGKEETR